MNVPVGKVLAVHTDLRPSLLPGGYTAELLNTFPNAQLFFANATFSARQTTTELITMTRLALREFAQNRISQTWMGRTTRAARRPNARGIISMRRTVKPSPTRWWPQPAA
ncbi:hypothetical protein ACFYO2_21430 [Streptomyces sp. NPDC006602]|uniref:hypothetical protein n=1 Tax=Streptomyces sp. NPDC006602 TaxID=3364751 RepID=UPI003684E5F1